MSRSHVITVGDPARLGAEAARLLADGFRLALVGGHDDRRPSGGHDDRRPSGGHDDRQLSGGHDDRQLSAGHDGGSAGIRVVYLFVAGPPDRRVELHLRIDPAGGRLPSLATLSFPASRFEREVRDLFGVEIDGHPMPAPLVHHSHWPEGWHPMRRDAGPRPVPESGRSLSFVPVAGDGVYEIPVGPVHAGLIEPGHFRFSVVGETVLKLKARLWYVHKGIEKLAEGLDIAGALPLAERISGDTAVGHGLAYSLAVEDALDVAVAPQASAVRVALLELERLHNHAADIGALGNDVAFGIANAHATRIRERLLRLNKATTGHRLLRGGVFPGGAALVAVPPVAEIAQVAADVAEIVEIALHHSVVRDRFAGTAVLTRQQALDIGTVGYVARASGVSYDARAAHPVGEALPGFAPAVRDSGDVLARFRVRADEVAASAAILGRILPALRPGRHGEPLAVSSRTASAPPNAAGSVSGVGIVEGWRGAITHRVELDGTGHLSRLKIVDPSFLNWPALPVAMADTIVPDFPLANKSFNLSYAGNDL